MIRKATISGILAILISIPLFSSTAEAQDMKIGFVEPRAILERMPEMRAVEQRLQNFIQRLSEEISQKEQDLQRAYEEYQQRIGVISDAAREAEEERLGEMEFELRQMQSEAQQEFQERQAELMAPLLDQIQETIDAVARDRGIDYVLNTTTQAGDVIILYVREELRDEYDITDEVMRRMEI